ncbi:MAG: hypothetical protein EOP36_13360 [Rubrivivax sp.]|nr:MAG: hypothetical protein EOP36_13360 [Rubrivivax sp.]
MTHTQHTVTAAAMLAALATIMAAPAHALTNGLTPVEGNVINPLNGQTLNVWKLVGEIGGTGGASAFQIHRKWILSARHAAPSGRTFTSHLGTSQVGNCIAGLGHATYEIVSPDDFVLCPLVNPTGLADYGTYPPLAARPVYTAANAGNFGALVAYGFGDRVGGATLAIVDFTGWPYEYNPALGVLNQNTIPWTVPGDSGGAVYWVSPTSTQPAVVAVTTGAGVVNFATPMSDTTIQWIRDTIAQHGDVPPVGLLASQHYTGTTANRAKPLDTPPTVTWNGSGVTVNWASPANDPSVQQYGVTFGHDGVLERSLFIAAGTGNNLVVNNLAAGANYVVCVRPQNAVGPANPGDAGALSSNRWSAPNCAAFDPRTPAARSLSINVAPTPSGLYTATASWTAPALTPAMVLGKYRLSQTITYPTGPKRTTTSELAGNATTYSASLSKGSQICLTLTPVTPIGQAGPSSTQCKTAP